MVWGLGVGGWGLGLVVEGFQGSGLLGFLGFLRVFRA